MLLLLLSGAHAAPPISGGWRLAEASDALQVKHEQAVQTGLSRLPRAMRPLAKPQLAKTVRNCAKVELALEGEHFRARCDDEKPFEHAVGVGQITGKDGKPYEVTVTVSDATVTLRFSGEQGGQQTTYAPQPDGSLLLTKEVFSPWLESPFSWTVRYTR